MTDQALSLIAREAVERVAPMIRDGFTRDVHIEYKSSDWDPVTEVDRAAEVEIREFLLSRAPGSQVLGEEFGRTEGEGDLLWHIDPIDGTHSFIAGFAYFCTSVAVERGGQLIAGAIHDPIQRETFWTGPGGLWLNDQVLPSASENPGTAGILTSQPFQGLRVAPGDMGDFLDLLSGFGAVRNPGSYALQLAHAAAGRTQAALEITAAAPWDIAGGMALARAAGCTIDLLVAAEEGYGDWGSHSYLVTRDAEVARMVGAALREYISRGTVPSYFTRRESPGA